MNKRRFDAAIFDMDGLILDSERFVLSSWVTVGARYGLVGIEDFAHSVLGQNTLTTNHRFVERYGSEVPLKRILEEKRRIFLDAFDRGEVPLKPYVKELMGQMRDLGMKICLASSTSRCTVTYEMHFWGIDVLLDGMICGDEVKACKPDPEIFIKACAMAGALPSRSIGLEDSYNGIRSCKRAGLFTCMVPDLIMPDDEMRSLSDCIVGSLEDVSKFLTL
ncbi:MAG: HAD family phosphatase [Saccharofermentans sp.]|nr:HAD family phosphatase [Mageeibacillus sp.]MCI1263988.1 HAD family phosphatase [Saccharofermentans sp.]MCI1274550.1 HAD family phosphatase [Saccharofermentans sp.]MCI1768933.1 HAD family phosphatase [Mageeibacillus sp.]MCI2043836.1 HAD family phosphatase [Mageeibacillus sp.]